MTNAHTEHAPHAAPSVAPIQIRELAEMRGRVAFDYRLLPDGDWSCDIFPTRAAALADARERIAGAAS